MAFREDAAHGVPGAGSRETTYEVRIWSVRRFTGRRGSTYRVRWSVAGQETGRTFPTRALADRFRSDLVAATNRGELFDVAEGLPVSMVTRDRETSWWDWAVTYAELRRAMMQWAFIPPRRQAGEPPETLARAVCWLRRNTVKVAVLRDPATARSVLDAIARKLDGSRAAASTIARKRAVFFNALELAVERELLPHNPLRSLRWSAPKTAEAIDPACVVNPDQARALLAAVAQVGAGVDERARSGGDRLAAFFGCLYYCGTRPSEALALRDVDLQLPEGDGEWGLLRVSRNDPEVTTAWTDNGKREARQLKHRAAGVDSAQIAAWVGHSVAVLHRVYVHVLPGRDEIARRRIEDILRRSGTPDVPEPPGHSERTANAFPLMSSWKRG